MSSSVSLLDIAEITETVSVRGKDIRVTGISAAGIAHLMNSFDEIKNLIAQRSEGITMERIIQLAPDIVAAVIAAGLGHPGEKDHEKVAMSLSAGEQLDIMKSIWKLTFPKGLHPFMQDLRSLAEGQQSK